MSQNQKPIPCPLCEWPIRKQKGVEDEIVEIDCPRCGVFRISRDYADDLRVPSSRNFYFSSEKMKSALCHHVTQLQQVGRPPFVSPAMLERFKTDLWLPALPDQLNNLLRAIGEKSEPGEWILVDAKELIFFAGAGGVSGVILLLIELFNQRQLDIKSIDGLQQTGVNSVSLTFSGWAKLEELKRGVASGRKAFCLLAESSGYGELLSGRMAA
jgi:hypothetical protein